MKLITSVLIFLIALVVIVFTVNNTELVPVDLWPLMSEPVAIPVTALTFAGIFFGLIAGFVVSWFLGGRTRRKARALQRRVEADQREMAVQRKQLAKFEAAERDAKIPLPPPKAA